LCFLVRVKTGLDLAQPREISLGLWVDRNRRGTYPCLEASSTGQAGLELVILQLQLPECWDYRHVEKSFEPQSGFARRRVVAGEGAQVEGTA
jgi:hypothetical protein